MKKAFIFIMLISSISNLTATCPFGYNGDKCDECGLVYYTQNARIIGGVQAVENSWPSLVYLRFSYTKTINIAGGRTATYTFGSSCGGTIIDRKTILTAAHCIVNTVSYKDVYGNQQTTPVETNTNNPTLASMYSVYTGLQDKSTINNLKYPAVKMSVETIIKVNISYWYLYSVYFVIFHQFKKMGISI